VDEQDPPSAQSVPRPISRRAVLQAMGGAAVMGAVALGTGGAPAGALTRPRPRQALLLRSATRRALSGAAPDFPAQVTRRNGKRPPPLTRSSRRSLPRRREAARADSRQLGASRPAGSAHFAIGAYLPALHMLMS